MWFLSSKHALQKLWNITSEIINLNIHHLKTFANFNNVKLIKNKILLTNWNKSNDHGYNFQNFSSFSKVFYMGSYFKAPKTSNTFHSNPILHYIFGY